MKMIDVFNRAVSDAIKKDGDFYKAWIGQNPYTPEATIVDSDDINCGALCNELEFARLVSDYYVQSFDLDLAEEDELVELINAFIDLPRRGGAEEDSIFRNRFRFIVNQSCNPHRATKWAIKDALRYYIPEVDSQVQIVEPFDDTNCYFQIRIEATTSTDDIIFMNSLTTGAIDQFYVGGPGIGEGVTYIDDLIARIKAAGVDFDIYYIQQASFTTTSDAVIGFVQMYFFSGATVKAAVSFTKTSDAKIEAEE